MLRAKSSPQIEQDKGEPRSIYLFQQEGAGLTDTYPIQTGSTGLKQAVQHRTLLAPLDSVHIWSIDPYRFESREHDEHNTRV